MKMVKWNPFQNSIGISRGMEKLSNQEWVVPNRQENWNMDYFTPPLNEVSLEESDHAFLLQLYLPDIERQDISVLWSQGVVTVMTKQSVTPEGTQDGPGERAAAHKKNTVRQIFMPHEVDSEHIQAEFKNGILLVTLPKREDDSPREIQVEE